MLRIVDEEPDSLDPDVIACSAWNAGTVLPSPEAVAAFVPILHAATARIYPKLPDGEAFYLDEYEAADEDE